MDGRVLGTVGLGMNAYSKTLDSLLMGVCFRYLSGKNPMLLCSQASPRCVFRSSFRARHFGVQITGLQIHLVG